jgi:hypothetical protein|tara:strand:- start:137 stop:355 length:219 start_codon:yes stop_codon:yes gene_type:complete
MPIKFVIGHNIKDPEEIDVPRGMNYVNTNDVILLKKNGKNKTYVVDSITHKIDYDVSIKVATTHIRLKELKD